MTIAISRGTGSTGRLLRYAEWLTHSNPALRTADLSLMPHAQALEALSACDGLLLSGGKDVHPTRYNHNHRLQECVVDEERDAREWDYLTVAMERHMPTLGICRGMQLMNVYFGGTLVIDIPSDIAGAYAHRGIGEPGARQDAWHFINDTRTGEEGTVNSAHHQSVQTMAESFSLLARAPDGVTEAMEARGGTTPPMLAVQWHPERMPYEAAFSKGVAEKFLAYIK